jgi:hypothetical protein
MAKEKSSPPTELTIPVVFKIGDTEINREILIAQRDIDVLHTINGITDTAGYKRAVELRGLYRTTRTTAEKVRKELSAPHQAYIKKLKETTDELGAIASVGEEYFDGLIVAIDNEKEKIKQEKILEQQRRVSSRVSEITAMGARFDGETYTFDYNEDIFVELPSLQSWTDEQYAEYLEEVKTAWANEQTRLHEETLKEQQEEAERQAAAEEVRIQAEANELQEKNLLAKRTALRQKEIKLLGGVLQDDDTYLFPGKEELHLAPLSALIDYTDEAWEELVQTIENYEPPATISLEEVAADVAANPPANDYSGVAADAAEQAEKNPTVISDIDDTLVDHLKETGYIEEKMVFDKDEPYMEFDLTPKTMMRLFPNEYAYKATGNCTVITYGNFRSLCWAVIKK